VELIRGSNYFPLRNTGSVLNTWDDNQHPSVYQWNIVVGFLYGLEHAYWSWPSVPELHLSVPGEYEVRSATPSGAGATIWYLYHHVEVWIDLLLIT